MTSEKTYILEYKFFSSLPQYRSASFAPCICLDYNIIIFIFQPKLLKIYYYFGKMAEK